MESQAVLGHREILGLQPFGLSLVIFGFLP